MRFILGFIGAVFALVLLISFFGGIATYFKSPPAPQASDEFHREPKELALASDGAFGHFDKRQVQRGFQRGIDQLVQAIRPTLGPLPRHVVSQTMFEGKMPEFLDNGAVIALIWAGLARYMDRTGHTWLAGCCSIPLADGGITSRSGSFGWS